MTWADVFEEMAVEVASRDALIANGASGRLLAVAVKSGALVRARRDHYLLPTSSPQLTRAVRVGGRLACVSALSHANVFAMDARFPHIHLNHSMARLRSPRSRTVPLRGDNRDGAELHWWPLIDEEPGVAHSVSIIDSLAQSLRCQSPWHALASIDNALFLGAVQPFGVRQIFELMPERLQSLQPLVDGRAEAGQETVLRMIVRAAGLNYELQVWIPGVGRVDMLVEGCLVVEADSRLAHDGWEKHVEDRHRDLVLASQGYMSLRPAYQHTIYEPDLVRASILGLLTQGRNFRRTFS